MSDNNENKNEENLNNGEEQSNIIELLDENGKSVKFEFLDLIEYENNNYVILLPAEEVEDEDSDEVVILKEDTSADNGEQSYVSVEDEETLNKVFEIFKEKFKDDFNFVD